MNTWAPIWSGIVDSSIWDESDVTIKIFLTMLALKDADHVVRLSAYQIGRNSRKSELEVLEALKILSSPDTKRLEPQPFEGRRVEMHEDGWLILNGEKYREMVSDEMRKLRLRKAQANFRAKKAGKPLPYPRHVKPGDVERSPEYLTRKAAALEESRIANQKAFVSNNKLTEIEHER